ncbi:MAG: TorF family putative porin [Gammaproteobacteria bacterium]|nr:TorF family putative porin [Gammaproteobacteria bacterium]MDH5799779.1 TorF family putative porin [Gammaproteobacteria bacterium]
MKVVRKLAPVCAAVSLALSGTVAPQLAQAEATAKLGIASMYLWRGQNVSPDGAQVHGTLQYASNGFYGGMWTSSETGGHETDLYIGYSGKAGEVSYDVSYWNYLYPEEGGSLSETDAAEVVGTVGYGPVSVGLYINVDSDIDDYTYFTLGGSFDKYTLTYGMWSLDQGSIAGTQDEYSHLTLSYAATDALSFTVSKAFSDLDKNDPAAVEEDPLFQVAYGWDFKL